jgi:hypothetical protein
LRYLVYGLVSITLTAGLRTTIGWDWKWALLTGFCMAFPLFTYFYWRSCVNQCARFKGLCETGIDPIEIKKAHEPYIYYRSDAWRYQTPVGIGVFGPLVVIWGIYISDSQLSDRAQILASLALGGVGVVMFWLVDLTL